MDFSCWLGTDPLGFEAPAAGVFPLGDEQSKDGWLAPRWSVRAPPVPLHSEIMWPLGTEVCSSDCGSAKNIPQGLKGTRRQRLCGRHKSPASPKNEFSQAKATKQHNRELCRSALPSSPSHAQVPRVGRESEIVFTPIRRPAAHVPSPKSRAGTAPSGLRRTLETQSRNAL